MCGDGLPACLQKEVVMVTHPVHVRTAFAQAECRRDLFREKTEVGDPVRCLLGAPKDDHDHLVVRGHERFRIVDGINSAPSRHR